MSEYGAPGLPLNAAKPATIQSSCCSDLGDALAVLIIFGGGGTVYRTVSALERNHTAIIQRR